MSGKKPVWVDEDAHALLKRYAKLTGASMVELASQLVLGRLNDLDPASGLETATAVGATDVERAPEKPALGLRPIAPKKRAPKRAQPEFGDSSVRYVGGIWIV